MHVTGTTLSLAGADAAAVRVYRTAGAPGDDVCALSPGEADAAGLARWAMDPAGVFGQLQRLRPEELTCRVSERWGDGLGRWGPLEGGRGVTDAVAMTWGVREPTWCAAVWVRRGGRVRFEDEVLAKLTALRPTLAWVVLTGLQRATHVGLPAVAAEPVTRPRGAEALDRLSETERRVLDLLMEGLTEREAAERIGRSPHTVHVHVKNVYRKLDVTSRRQLRQAVGSGRE